MPAVANVLARAFFDDPLFTYVSPDATLRHGQLRAFMAFCCRYGDRFGEIYTTAGTVDGAALWAPPSAVPDFTPEQLEAAGIAHAVQALGEEAMGRFGAVLDHLEALRQRDMPAPHWYLFGLGVDPDRQGRGIGGQLLQPMLRRADAAGLPCHLETQKVRNLPFYQRHGFAVLTETDVPWGGPHLWIMQRPPLAIAPAWQAGDATSAGRRSDVCCGLGAGSSHDAGRGAHVCRRGYPFCAGRVVAAGTDRAAPPGVRFGCIAG